MQLAEEMFKDHTRKLAEECISRALEISKSRSRTGYGWKYFSNAVSGVICLSYILFYGISNSLAILSCISLLDIYV